MIKIGYTRVTVDLSPDDYALLNAVNESTGVKKVDILREALRAYAVQIAGHRRTLYGEAAETNGREFAVPEPRKVTIRL